MSRPLGAVFVRWGTPRDPHPPALTLTTLVRRREKRIGLTSNYLDVTHTHTHTHTTLSHTTLSHKQCRAHTALSHTHTTLSHTHISVAHNIVTKNFVTNTSFTHTHTLNSSYWKKMTWRSYRVFYLCIFFLQRITKYPSPHFQERVLYRLLSGWHASTSISIAKNFYAPGHWSYNVRPPS